MKLRVRARSIHSRRYTSCISSKPSLDVLAIACSSVCNGIPFSTTHDAQSSQASCLSTESPTYSPRRDSLYLRLSTETYMRQRKNATRSLRVRVRGISLKTKFCPNGTILLNATDDIWIVPNYFLTITKSTSHVSYSFFNFGCKTTISFGIHRYAKCSSLRNKNGLRIRNLTPSPFLPNLLSAPIWTVSFCPVLPLFQAEFLLWQAFLRND